MTGDDDTNNDDPLAIPHQVPPEGNPPSQEIFRSPDEKVPGRATRIILSGFHSQLSISDSSISGIEELRTSQQVVVALRDSSDDSDKTAEMSADDGAGVTQPTPAVVPPLSNAHPSPEGCTEPDVTGSSATVSLSVADAPLSANIDRAGVSPGRKPPQGRQQAGQPATKKRRRGRNWTTSRGSATMKNRMSIAQEIFRYESQETKDTLLMEGSAVYAPFPGKNPPNESYYWGKIVKKWRKSGNQHWSYKVYFNDGDKLKNIGSKFLHRLTEVYKLSRVDRDMKIEAPPIEYRNCWNKEDGPPPPLSFFQKPAKEVGVPPEQIQDNNNTVRPPGRAQQGQEWDEEQGMWVPRATFPEHNEDATKAPTTKVAKLELTAPEPGTDTAKESHGMITGAPLEELFRNRCKKCSQCRRPSCGVCTGCRFNQCSRRASPQTCVQTMCLEIPMEDKRQRTQFLPDGWFYAFQTPMSNPAYQGLVLLRHKWMFSVRSYEAARNRASQQFTAFGDEQRREFYRHVGLESALALPPVGVGRSHERGAPLSPTLKEPPHRKRQCISDVESNPPLSEGRPPHEITEVNIERGTSIIPNQSLNPRGQYQHRCGSCTMCRRDECERCASCYENKGRSSRFPQVCFRKMCMAIPVERKKVPANGFGDGWSFCFLPAEGTLPSEIEHLRGLAIFSPAGQGFSNVDEAFKAFAMLNNISVDEKRKREFFEQIGASTFRPLAKHPLLGELHMQEWIRVDCTKMIITGNIVAAEKDVLSDDERFTISYNPESLAMVRSGCPAGLKVNPSAQLDSYSAWDGCLRSHEEMIGPTSKRLHTRKPLKFERWLTPLSVSRGMAPIEGAQLDGYRELPVLRLRHKGYLLKFQVRKSVIEGARFGVFLSIFKELDVIPNEFSLEPGELLDFGVYAPFRAEDVRSDHEFLVKSLIHECKNEVYAWESNSREKYLDITDTWTGDLHMIARTHVHPFVNEIQDPTSEIPNVLPRMDPEGALHYLLGHAPKYSDEPFKFVADGSEHEIFVNYEEHYENVRLREGYPRTALSAEETSRKLQNEEQEYVKEIEATFTETEVFHFVKTFKPMMSSGLPLSKSVVLRMMAVSILMRRRAEVLVMDCLDPQLDLRVLIRECEEAIQESSIAWRGWHGSTADLLLEARKSSLFTFIVERVHPGYQLGSLDENVLIALVGRSSVM